MGYEEIIVGAQLKADGDYPWGGAGLVTGFKFKDRSVYFYINKALESMFADIYDLMLWLLTISLRRIFVYCEPCDYL